MKRELQVGDRVRIYWDNGSSDKGAVVEAPSEFGRMGVKTDCGSACYVTNRICRRLVPRKKPCPPQGERVAIYVSYAWLDKLNSEATHHTDGGLVGVTIWKREPVGVPCVHLVELKPGEVILDRAKLAMAWDDCGFSDRSKEYGARVFPLFCKALGLEGSAP